LSFKLLWILLLIMVNLTFVGTPMSSASNAGGQDKKLIELAPGVYDVPIVLPPSLEPRREEFRQDFIAAQKRLREFATKNGWEHLTDAPFVKQAEIYDTKAGYDGRVYALSPNLQGKPIPKTFSAGIEDDVFFAVSPEICDENFPEGKEPDSYIKLITHELAHRLHVRILNGNEDKMGPIWFFEGFAVYAADQYVAHPPDLTEADIWSIVDAKDRGSYRKYKVVFSHFLKGLTLPEYVKQASEPNFTAWLRSRDKGTPGHD